MQGAVPGVSRRVPVESGTLPRILEVWYLREGRVSPEKNLTNRFPSLGIPIGWHLTLTIFPLDKEWVFLLQPWLVARGDWVPFTYPGTEFGYAVVDPKA